jgi:hypothetical protein
MAHHPQLHTKTGTAAKSNAVSQIVRSEPKMVSSRNGLPLFHIAGARNCHQ